MTSALLICRAAANETLPASNGYLLLSALSYAVKKNGVSLFFSGDTNKPALSPLMPLVFWEGERRFPSVLDLQRNELAASWISFLGDDAFCLFANSIVGQTLTIGGAGFTVEAVTVPGENAFSECVSLEMLENIPPSDRVNIEFLTPTGFKHNDIQCPMPTPELFFGSGAIRLSCFTGKNIPHINYDAVETEMFSLRSRAVPLKGGAVFRGCTGDISYSFRKCTEEERYWLTLISVFSFFSGAGYKTSQGMGRVMPSFKS